MFLHAISLTKEIQSNSLNFLLQLMLGWKVYLAVRSALNAHSQWFLFHLKYYVSIERNYHLLQGKMPNPTAFRKLISPLLLFNSIRIWSAKLFVGYTISVICIINTHVFIFSPVKCLNKSFLNAFIRWHDLFVEIKFCSGFLFPQIYIELIYFQFNIFI